MVKRTSTVEEEVFVRNAQITRHASSMQIVLVEVAELVAG
jgi:hypothetical protein